MSINNLPQTPNTQLKSFSDMIPATFQDQGMSRGDALAGLLIIITTVALIVISSLGISGDLDGESTGWALLGCSAFVVTCGILKFFTLEKEARTSGGFCSHIVTPVVYYTPPVVAGALAGVKHISGKTAGIVTLSVVLTMLNVTCCCMCCIVCTLKWLQQQTEQNGDDQADPIHLHMTSDKFDD